MANKEDDKYKNNDLRISPIQFKQLEPKITLEQLIKLEPSETTLKPSKIIPAPLENIIDAGDKFKIDCITDLDFKVKPEVVEALNNEISKFMERYNPFHKDVLLPHKLHVLEEGHTIASQDDVSITGKNTTDKVSDDDASN